jgi:hypothetical protein
MMIKGANDDHGFAADAVVLRNSGRVERGF